MSLRPNGLKKLTTYLRPDQYLRLRATALEQVMEADGGRPDISRILRDLVDMYFEAQDATKERPHHGSVRNRATAR